MPAVTVVLVFLTLAAQADPSKAMPRWEPQTSGTTARFRGVCAVNDQVAWASGTEGTFSRTTDGGQSWRPGRVAGASGLDFRDVEAFDDGRAVLLASGPGEKSRVYRTTDGGETWSLRFTNPDPDGFLDAIAFWGPDHGLAFGDPVGGRFRVFLTDDGGSSWHPAGPEGIPPARNGEGAFAASGTCMVALRGTRKAWFATGGVGGSRVFRTDDGGRTWAASQAPIRSGTASAGVFSLDFANAKHGVAIGGDYKLPDEASPNLARTDDGGITWSLVKNGPVGYRSAVAYVSATSLVAVGPTGSDLTAADGSLGKVLSKTGYHAVSLAPSKLRGWAVGDDGRVARLVAR